jgi:hypothetical protein
MSTEDTKAVDQGAVTPETKADSKALTNDIVQGQKQALATVKPAYVTAVINAMQQQFLAVNEGLDLDFVYMGSWLVIDKKGIFVEKDTKDDPANRIAYGDTIDVVIAKGEQRWSLWGHQDSKEDGQLIVAHKDKEQAIEMFRQWQAENPESGSEYTEDEVLLRYLAYVVPVETIKPGDFPKIYLFGFSPTATIAFGKWAFDKVFQGRYSNAGIPKGTGINRVVCRLTTSEKKKRDNASIQYIGIDFGAVGMFNPADYGIVEYEG